MDKWKTIPADEIIEQVAQNLTKNGFTALVVATAEEAKNKTLEFVPEGSEVLANTSITLEQIGVLDVIDNSGKYNSVRKKVFSLDYQKESDQIRDRKST